MAGMLLFLSAVAGTGNGPFLVEERVDLVEVNHYHDGTGRRVLNQVIFYRWSDRDGRYHVHAWRLIKSDGQLPVAAPGRGYLCVWHDDGILRRVHARHYVESWTQVDPEKDNRQYLPQNARTELAKRTLRPWLDPGESPRLRPSARVAEAGLDDGTSRR